MRVTGATETFKNIRQLQNGNVIIECQDKRQQEQLHGLMKNQSDLQVKELTNTDPMIMITGIDAGYKPADFVKEFVEDNHQMKDVFGDAVEHKFKFIAKKFCINKQKENWILQTPPDLFKWLIRNEGLTFDLTKAYIQEYINLAICFKCCSFGHVAKYCKGELCCHKCGNSHEPQQCPNTLDCPNRKKSNFSDRSHSARDKNCPAFQRKLKRQREYTNFNTTDTEGTFL